MSEKTIIGLIPARSGSERVPDKNISKINDEPLLCRAIRTALKSEIFSKLVVSTDSSSYAKIVSEAFGNKVDVLIRPTELSKSDSPDYDWVQNCADRLNFNSNYDAFAILRCTSPFRTVQSIRACWEKLNTHIGYNHIRHEVFEKIYMP